MDVVHAVIKKLDYYRYTAIGVVLAVILCIGVVGCEPKTLSLTDSGEHVSNYQLNDEYLQAVSDIENEVRLIVARIDTLEKSKNLIDSRYENRLADLAAKQMQAQKILETISGVGQLAIAGTVNPATVFGTVFSLVAAGLAGGAMIDGRRKDQVILDIKRGDNV